MYTRRRAMSNLNLKQLNKSKDTNKALTWENLVKYGVITQAKADIATHPAKRKVIVGGKGTGKTHIPNVKAIYQYETNDYFNAFGFRKYKEAAYDALGSYFSSTLAVMRARGFEPKMDYEMRSYNFYRMKDKRNMLKNQIFRFGSLEDASGSTDGKAPAAGGYFGLVEIDEPVVKQDVGNPDKIPTAAKFNEDMDIIRDNLERYNDTFEDAFPDQPAPTYEEWFTMNDWGDHPLTLRTQEVLPVEKFFEFNFGYTQEHLLGNIELLDELFESQDFINSIMSNNTMSVYVADEDTLYTRMTKFANPNNWKEKRAKPLINKVRGALEVSDMNALAILMGYRHEGNMDDKMLVYHKTTLDSIEHSTQQDFIDKGFRATAISYAVDVDYSRVMTITPTILFEKESLVLGGKNKRTQRILIDRQIEMQAYGSGSMGENNEMYVNGVVKAINKHYSNMVSQPKKVVAVIDDNQKWFLHEIAKKASVIKHFKPAVKQGMFDIYNRQNAMVSGFESQVVHNHPKNKALEQDMKVCLKRDIKDVRRKTSGATNYLDRIDSAEYGLEIFTSVIWRNKRR